MPQKSQPNTQQTTCKRKSDSGFFPENKNVLVSGRNGAAPGKREVIQCWQCHKCLRCRRLNQCQQKVSFPKCPVSVAFRFLVPAENRLVSSRPETLAKPLITNEIEKCSTATRQAKSLQKTTPLSPAETLSRSTGQSSTPLATGQADRYRRQSARDASNEHSLRRSSKGENQPKKPILCLMTTFRVAIVERSASPACGHVS